MSSLRPLRIVPALALLAALAQGCSDDDDDPPPAPANQGTLTVFATDAPPDLEGIRTFILHVQRIDLIAPVTTGATAVSTTIFDVPAPGPAFDLVPLRGGVQAPLVTVNVAEGTYERVRLFFSRAQVDFQPPGNVPQRTFSTENGLLTFAGGAPPQLLELELPGGLEVQAGRPSNLLIDLDLASSIEAVGDPSNPTELVVDPVGRARDLSNTGAVAGVVRAGQNTADGSDDVPLANVVVELAQGTDVVAQTLTDAAGVFVFEGVPPGTYSLGARATDQAPILTSVQVVDQRVTSDIIIPTATVP